MDAREYLARKGLDGERDRERPNTLEEKAWGRARESHDHRPRAGTPHDWEDWERYHDVLAEGADSLEQKIDTEAHRQAQERAREQAQRDQTEALDGPAAQGPIDTPSTSPASRPAVEHFTPPPAPGHKEGTLGTAPRDAAQPAAAAPRVASALMASPAARLALMVLVLLMPPLAVAVAEGGSRRVAIAFLLTLLGWLPGVAYGAWWLKQVNH